MYQLFFNKFTVILSYKYGKDESNQVPAAYCYHCKGLYSTKDKHKAKEKELFFLCNCALFLYTTSLFYSAPVAALLVQLYLLLLLL
jgi:hypothetical protein